MGKTKGLPAIIHCKDTGDGAAAARALELITQLGCRVMRFHRHCFNGDLLELQQWHALPNTVFGVTWKSVRESPDFIPRINLDQLVLETDSPYLSLYSCCPTNHPWNLPAVALEVASLRNVPLSVLNWTTNENIEILRHAEGISVLWSGALDVVQMTTSSCKYSVNTFAVVIPGRCFHCDQQMTLVMYISFPYSG
jgi:Tat protein secretion system quality control protein TatD with DNase activity